jgi:starvation-inducible DNA-binding protein
MAVVKVFSATNQEVNTGIAEKARAAVAEKLAGFLADSYMLQLKTQYYHWNVSGVQFFSLHALFEGQYKALFDAVDEIAERIRALGFAAPGTLKSLATLGGLSEDKTLPSSAAAMTKNLLDANEALSRSARETIAMAEKAGDVVTVDLLVRRADAHEKAAWMLRSSL